MRSQQGITLLDTMMAMAFMTLMIGWGIPWTQQWYASRALDAQMRDVQGLIQQAQMASLDHGRSWKLCGSHDGKRCDGRWHYLLVVDAKGHVRYRNRSHDAVTLRWQGLSQALVFHPRLSSSMLNGTFYLCHARKTRRLIINRLGRLRFQTTDAGDGC
ncbi:GspH/FimT family pseudopilin [Kushneria sp. TE3]|uniref:GspH/FimT family pseudopilin n=1 Tax=Kushneria sp. TE3 TaxID=3449832 RepID=UPI003F68736A